ncbi:MAG: YfhO family protein [Oscillospiraceae bacterium]|jgi:hypothetical protein|nr:YfhO family protein [Oscillospiraceae bacterium]
MAAILALLSLAPAIFPYGGRMVTRGDFMEQQIPFILETKRMLASGTPFWDWNTFLGENFFGAYSFYTIGSPFVWLLLPLPEWAIPFGISVAAILKHVVAALTAYLYLRRFVRECRWAQMGALLYAFSSYSAINTQFYHFMDVVAVFPLLLAGLENAFSSRRRFGALALACGLNAMVNYYFFWGSVLFVALYAAVRVFSQDWRAKLRRGRKAALWQCFSVMFECGLGCLLAAWILLPAGWAMLGISRTDAIAQLSLGESYTWSNTLERIRALWMPIESGVLHAFFGDASSWSSIAAFLPMFGCTLVLWHFLSVRKSWLHALLPLLAIISVWPFFNRMFVLGSNIFYTRWWYALVLMLCIPTAQAMERLQAKHSGDLRRLTLALWLTAAVVCALTLPFMLPEAFVERAAGSSRRWLAWLGNALRQNATGIGYAGDAFRAFAWGLTGFILMCMWLATRRASIGRQRLLGLLLGVCVALNYAGFIAMNDALVPLDGGSGLSTGVDYYAGHMLLAQRPAFTGTTYTHRVDAPRKIRNYGMLINQPSITSFHSLRSAYLKEFVFLSGFGYDESPDAVPPDATSGPIRALLGVQTYYNYDEEHFPGAPDGFVYTGKVGEVSVYENPNALPLGFAYDRYINTDHYPVDQNNFSELMLSAAVMRNHMLYGLWDVMTEVEKGEPLPTWQEAAAQRKAQGCYDISATPGGLTAKIDLDKEKLVCFTVQYDKGWSATVNGQAVSVYRVNMGMIGLRVPEGRANQIALTFRVRGLRQGIWVSVGAALLLLGICLYLRRRRRATF